jgi:regulator of protease activity HflC (stomatin/prohibitin superfamily)
MLHLLVLLAVLPVGEFNAIETHNGAHVVIRYGAAQRVSVIEGDPRCTAISVAAGARLVIDNKRHDCGRDERALIEVVTPQLPAVKVSNGGIVRTLGTFPAQASIEAAVEQGGTLDIRSIVADRVAASVYSGGRIFTNARKTLDARVDSGGIINYWGDVEDVHKSVHNGGVVQRGTAKDQFPPQGASGVSRLFMSLNSGRS